MTQTHGNIDKDKVLGTLNAILELELAGVVRYMHYSFMIFGHSRIPVTKWMRDQAHESLAHAEEAGELITSLGGHPSLRIGKLLETQQHDIDPILEESLQHERESLFLYRELLDATKDESILLEEYARRMIAAEQMHVAEVTKMLGRPGDA